MSSKTGARILTAVLLVMALGGCRISEHKDSHGGDKDVDIKTPLGSLSVHKGSADAKETGLALYPGAQIARDSENEGGSANVNISSSFFGVKVVALKYQSNDSPDKVLGFYRKEMAKYGKVLDCTGGFRMNFGSHGSDNDREVTCDTHVGSDHDYREELKVGTERNQRIVAVKPSGNGSEFALVYVRARDEKDTM